MRWCWREAIGIRPFLGVAVRIGIRPFLASSLWGLITNGCGSGDGAEGEEREITGEVWPEVLVAYGAEGEEREKSRGEREQGEEKKKRGEFFLLY